MDIFQAFSFVAARGVALLEACHSRSAYDIAGLGYSLDQAKAFKRTADAYLGAADSPRVQRETLAVASARGLSMERLTMINRHAKALTRRGVHTRRGAAWKLRAELVAMTASFEEVNAHGKKRVAELVGPTVKESGVRIGRAVNGMRTMTITDSQRRITDLEKTLDAVTEARATHATRGPEKREPKKRAKELLESWWEHLDSGAGLIQPAYRTVIAIGLEDCVKVLRGEGDDVIVGLSDGTTMTGAEMLASIIGGELGHDIFAGLFHPLHGPVNLYGARFASAKQRVLATAENLVCPWPGCGEPADRSQVHHIHPHGLGGDTKPTNLTMLCKYHNGVNDDNPNAPPKNGRMMRHRGQVRYRSPGGRLLSNTHLNSSLGAFSLI